MERHAQASRRNQVRSFGSLVHSCETGAPCRQAIGMSGFGSSYWHSGPVKALGTLGIPRPSKVAFQTRWLI